MKKHGQPFRSLALTTAGWDRQKFQLWEQLAFNETEKFCPFTGRPISLMNLFSDEIEVEHLLPFSSTLDDSMSNKVVCYREANRIKGKRSPFRSLWIFSDGYVWEDILERSKRLPGGKRWRFLPMRWRCLKRGGFMERHLNDMRYISRYTSQYLSTIYQRIRSGCDRKAHLDAETLLEP